MKQQRLKLGIRSGILFVIVLAVLVACNLLIEKADVHFDLSQEKIYTLSDQTKSILQGMEKDVTIYILSSEEDFPIGFRQLVNEYTRNSSHLTVLYRSIDLYPNFASQYMTNTSATVKENSLIVVSGEKHVYVDSDQFVSSDKTALKFEPLLTSAINYVADGETKMLYYISGHNEMELTEAFKSSLLRDNYAVNELALLNQEIPDDADILLIDAPTEDYSADECEKLQNYLDQGGRIYYIIEATIDLDHLYAFAEKNGIRVEPGVVMEQNSVMIYGDTPTYILPIIEDHTITKDMDSNRTPLLVLVSKGLNASGSNGYTSSGLLSTSNFAYSKVNLDSAYVSREDSDIVGPFYLAMVSESEQGGSLLVLGSSNLLYEEADAMVNGRNTDFVINGMDYLMGDSDKISIRSKEIEYNTNLYSTAQVYIFAAVSIIGIPLLLILTGIILVTLRNRRSKNWKKDEADDRRRITEEDEIEDREASSDSEKSENSGELENIEQPEDSKEPENHESADEGEDKDR